MVITLMLIKNLIHSLIRASLISNLISLISQSHQQSYLPVLLYSVNIDTSLSPSNCHSTKKRQHSFGILKSFLFVWFTALDLCYHLLKKIELLSLKKVVFFMNVRADVKLGT